MDFEFTPEQLAWRQEIRDFVKENQCEELQAEAWDYFTHGAGPLFRAWLRRLGEKRWLGAGWPAEFGGLGKGAIEQWIMVDELEYAHLLPIRSGLSMVGPTIMRFGSGEMKKEYLPRLLSGEIDFALGYSEPNAGSDLASLETRAVVDGDEIVINGQKVWNSGAHRCEYQWLAVRTDPDVPKHRGITMVIVPMDTPGITVRPLWTWGDFRTNETYFDDVRVPLKNVVGELNRGWTYITAALDFERHAIGPTGDIRRILDALLAYVKETRRNGRLLAEDPVIRNKLASFATELQVARLLSLRTATMVDEGQIPNAEASMVKVFNSELRMRFGGIGMQILGLYGQLKRESKWAPVAAEVEHMYRFSAALCFAGGTNEIQRGIIARRGLRLPS